MNILDIEAPLIAAVNGPVRLHSEYILLADIVLATPSTGFQDKPHFEFGIVPGDGVNLRWQEVIGTVRGQSVTGTWIRIHGGAFGKGVR